VLGRSDSCGTLTSFGYSFVRNSHLVCAKP
jgi:hypothetical protein